VTHPTAHSEFVPDGRVGEGSMPWNAKSYAGQRGPGVQKSDRWRSSKRAIDHGVEIDDGGV
jgi:hypothetical protein